MLLIITLSLFGSEAKWTRLLLEQMITNIHHPSTRTIVYVSDKKIHSFLRHSKKLILTDRCEQADIIISSTLKNDPTCHKDIPAIVLSYRAFKQRNDAIGAFFWQKGRPTIVYYQPRLEHYNLTTDSKVKRYVVKEF